MGLRQFILGKESADKKQAIYERISGIMTEEPDAGGVCVVVPEHAKFEAEMSILGKALAIRGFPRSGHDGLDESADFQFQPFGVVSAEEVADLPTATIVGSRTQHVRYGRF